MLLDQRKRLGADTFEQSLNPDGSLRDSPYGYEIPHAGMGGLAEEELPENVRKDRAAAAKDLAKYFQVSDKYGQPGTHLPNQITADEFEKVCAIYSDIRTGHGAISLESGEMDPAQAAKFKKDMMRDIASLLQTDSGRELLGSLNGGAHDVRLRAYHTDANGNGNRSDDGNAALDTSNAESDATEPNEGYPGGHGSDVDVRFNPGFNIDGLRADTVLFHELVHTYHQTRATTAAGCSTEDPGDNALESQAIGIGAFARSFLTENSYRSERARMGAGHAVEQREGDAGMKQRTSHNHGGGPISRDRFCGGPEAYDKHHAHDPH